MASRWKFFLLVLCAQGALASLLDDIIYESGEIEDSEESSIEDLNERLYEDLAYTYAPFIRFHKKEGEEGFCFPHDAGEYYNHRVAGDWSRLCNEDYQTIKNNEIPTYWHAMECSGHLHIDAWWEFVVVKIRQFDTEFAHLSEVMFGQKEGWYTRVFSHYEVFNATHPVAYVGRASHGFYHDDGGSNTCCYFEDTRNPGDANQYLMSWENLVRLTTEGTGEPWMADPSTDYWNGLQAPTFRKDWYLCNLVGCSGSFLGKVERQDEAESTLSLPLCRKSSSCFATSFGTREGQAFVTGCGTSGCAKSDTGDDPF
ncbi:hypothetical protein C7M84_012438 [Penaeus vannamei]|uniref:Uncharacterized protein n=1 Tax=Penaeus vannamei TaxID=6689 RepID=A0A3R7PF22_PENVA|nr:hypothetical protein C7M84_012438 [Penaeus vannamei]